MASLQDGLSHGVGPRHSAYSTLSNRRNRPFNNNEITGAAGITHRESIFPLCIMYLASAVVGFSGGIASNQSKAFQNSLGVTKGVSTGLEIGFYSAFLVMPLTLGAWLTRTWGYKVAVCVSLMLKSVGHIGYWPSSDYRFFTGFCISAFLNGAGAACALAALNPYVAFIGPKKHSDTRALICNTVYNAFFLIAELCQTFVFYGKQARPEERSSLDPIKWTNVGTSIFLLAVAGAIALVSIPEITDADMEDEAESQAAETGWSAKPLHQQTRFLLGVIACFFYDGAFIAAKAFFMNFIEEVLPHTTDRTAAVLNLSASGLGVLTKLATAGAVRVVRPRLLLAASFASCIACLSAGIGAGGAPAAALAVLEYALRAPISILIYTASWRGLGRLTKLGGAISTSTMGAGAIMTPLCGFAADLMPVRFAMCIPLGGIVTASGFAVYVNVWGAAELDLLRATEKQGETQVTGAMEFSEGDLEGRLDEVKPRRVVDISQNDFEGRLDEVKPRRQAQDTEDED